MIDYIKYRQKLAKLFRKKERLRAEGTADIRKAQREGKSREDIAALESDWSFEEEMVDEEIAALITGHLIRKARRTFVPIPENSTRGSNAAP